MPDNMLPKDVDNNTCVFTVEKSVFRILLILCLRQPLVKRRQFLRWHMRIRWFGNGRPNGILFYAFHDWHNISRRIHAFLCSTIPSLPSHARCCPSTSVSVFISFSYLANTSPSLFYHVFLFSSRYMPVPVQPALLHSPGYVSNLQCPSINLFAHSVQLCDCKQHSQRHQFQNIKLVLRFSLQPRSNVHSGVFNTIL